MNSCISLSGMTHGHSDLDARYTAVTPKEMTVPERGQQAVTARARVAYSSPMDSIGLPDADVVLQS